MHRPLAPWTVHEAVVVSSTRVGKVWQEQAVAPGGRQLKLLRLEVPEWVNVVAVTAQGQVVMVRQWRHGIGGVALEIPGGMVDPGESPLEAARRELKEETGYASERWRLLGKVRPNPAILNNTCYSYLALDARKLSEPTPEPTEQISVELVGVGRLRKMLASGEIDHALVVVALQWWLGAGEGSK